MLFQSGGARAIAEGEGYVIIIMLHFYGINYPFTSALQNHYLFLNRF